MNYFKISVAQHTNNTTASVVYPCLEIQGENIYVCIAGIPHDIAFGMCHVEYKSIRHNHVFVRFDLCCVFLRTNKNFN